MDTELEKLKYLLDLYRDACYTDITMEGVHFIGVNKSRYKQAWDKDREVTYSKKKETSI